MRELWSPSEGLQGSGAARNLLGEGLGMCIGVGAGASGRGGGSGRLRSVAGGLGAGCAGLCPVTPPFWGHGPAGLGPVAPALLQPGCECDNPL